MFESAPLNGASPAMDPQQMMEDLAGSDPRIAMLLQMMQAAPSEASNDDFDPDERDELIVELSEKLDAAEARLQKMTRIARRLHAEHQRKSDLLGQLASALGACGMCWGEDDDCPGCRGRGRIGMVRPDRKMRALLFGHQKVTGAPRKARQQPADQFNQGD